MKKDRSLTPADYDAIREGLAELPRAGNHPPGERVEPGELYTVDAHRAALDPERVLVVGNRGMGKSFWAHALAQDETRVLAADAFRQPALRSTTVEIGFNAAEQAQIAPSPETVQEALRHGSSAETIWRAVLVRAAARISNTQIPSKFLDVVSWVESDAERVGQLMSEADRVLVGSGRKLLVVFDALDRLGGGWETTQELTRGLLRRALAVRSHRAIRVKIFVRLDQYSDVTLFDFPDASKIRNTRVDLEWPTYDLYGLLFDRLNRSDAAGRAFAKLAALGSDGQQKETVDAIAGEFMGSDKKRGRVYTWLPLHLADAFGQTSPRTFLTAWREAAHHRPAPVGRAVDHAGIAEGVRKASEDRLHELSEDYWWISAALEPLRGQLVPIGREVLEGLWRHKRTAKTIISESKSARLAPVQLEGAPRNPESALVDALHAIGVLEIRTTGKINVPDIFRIEAGIKRKGGVKPPRRGAAA